MADAPKPGRAKPAAERFEIFETDPVAHLTEAQKTWKAVKLRPRSEQFAVLVPQPAMVLKLHLRQDTVGADRVALAADIFALFQALSEAERDLGGGGLILFDQRAEAGTVILTLRHSVAEGARQRATELTALLNNAKVESAEVGELLVRAARSSAGRVNLLVAGSRTVSRCEVLTVAA